jgi:hypothetical protein
VTKADAANRLIMVPFDARESISIAVAAKLSGKAPNTIRLWAEQYGIGRKIGGDWHISRVALRMFLDGDTAALGAYHAGNRNDPAVRSYFERVGCGALLQKSLNLQISQNQPSEPGANRGPLRFTMTANETGAGNA